MLLFPGTVRCIACDEVRRAKVNRIYVVAFVFFAAFTWFAWATDAPLTWWLPGFGWIVPAGISVWLLLTRKSRYCGSCGSVFVK